MELKINQVLQKAVEAHKAGKVQEAERLYSVILKAQPKHPDANHNLGVLAVSVGKAEEALPFMKTALEANPSIAQFWLSFIDVLIKLDRMSDAKAVLDQAKSIGAKGDSFDKLDQRLQNADQVVLEAKKLADEPQPNRPNILDSLKIDQAIKLAKKKERDGALQEAQLIYQDVLLRFPQNKRAKEGLMGLDRGVNVSTSKIQDPPQDHVHSLINLYSQGQLQQALKQAETLVKQFPKSAIVLNIQGVILKGMGQLNSSLEAYKKALAIKPDYAEAYYNMGNALKEYGKLEDAIDAYKKALERDPDYAGAYNNMGILLKEQGKLEEAIEAYKKVLTIKPDYAGAYNNLGNALKAQGKHDEAIGAYKNALAINPDYADAYNSLGIVLKAQGKLDEAIEAYKNALELNPDYADAYINLGVVLSEIVFTKPNPSLQKIITSLLDRKAFVRPSDIVRAAISLLKSEPKLEKYLLSSSVIEPEPKLPEIIKDLSQLSLLLKLMQACPLPDLDLEDLLRELRASLLLSISDLTGSAQELEFQSALALQCFTNEYIYNQSKREEEALVVLEEAVRQTLSNGDAPSPTSVLCLASYKPLHQYEWSSLLSVSDEIEDVFNRQVIEPSQEAKLKDVMPVLDDITDEVSSKVKDQYEVSPYPRWVNLGLHLKPVAISEVVDEINLKLFDDGITEIEAPDILIAGCGTGQHSIETATRFKGSKVLAIDLSLSSLSYAKRKTLELGIKNIEYLQADILDLGKIGRRFDIVESAGVLHHMEDPVAGWRVLTDCLKPGGLMQIGLYSELARQDIVEMRQEISKSGIGSSDAAMKSFRTTVMTSDQRHHKKILNSPDFYSLSALKDLLFHVQEHRFTIPQIQDILSELGLKFSGFAEAKIVSHFKLTYTNADDPYNLDRWNTYEEANPSAFAGMYQCWFQKLA